MDRSPRNVEQLGTVVDRLDEAHVQLALDAGRVVAFDTSFADDRIVLSDNAADLLGLPSGTRTMRRGDFYALIHPDDQPRLDDARSRAVSGLDLDDRTYRMVRPDDGQPRWLEVRTRPVAAADGRTVGARGILIDVTARHRVAASRLATGEVEGENRRLEEVGRFKRDLLANMSHELRTPLNAVIGFAELLHDELVPIEAPQRREFLGDILASARHLLALVNDVLELTGVESGAIELHPEAVVLPTVIAEVVALVQPTIASRRIDLQVELDPAVDALVLDPARLKQVLSNYLSNAVKFTGAGGQVVIRARPHGADHVRLEVEDTGIGIAADDLARLFVEFQQLDTGTAKQHAGTGLGLALTRRIVEAQGGTVGVSSRLGHGSVFHAILPRRPAAALP